MGAEQSILKQNGYTLEKETGNAVIATKGDDTLFITKIDLDQTSRNDDSAYPSEIEILKTINHPHVVSSKNSFEKQNIYYVVMDYCHGGSLAAKIKEMSEPPQEYEVLSWIVEICMALRTIHEKNLLHKRLTPEHILITESGTMCLGGFGKIHENLTTNLNMSDTINYLAPEVFAERKYDAKSDIWSVGCILYELCTLQSAFSAETPIKLIPKILSGPYPSLPDKFSPELCHLLKDMINKDPKSRPTASEILERPIMINSLSEKCKTTVKDLQTRLDRLRAVADGLERVHHGTTIGSLTGGVIGAVGGITSIVGLVLAPFTLGASLVVTGVGVGVGVAGGVTASASNITNMVNQSSDRKAVRSIIKEIEQKFHAVVTWLQEISNSLQTIRSRCDSADTPDTEDRKNLAKLGCRAGKGLSGIAELVRLVQVINVGKIAAQASRVVRVAEVATGVFAGLFVAVDLFFIAMDAKEIHNIRQAKAAEEGGKTGSESVSGNGINDYVHPFDKVKLSIKDEEIESDRSEPQDHPSIHPSSTAYPAYGVVGELEPIPADIGQKAGYTVDRSPVAQGQSSQNTAPIRSEIMKFVRSIRQAADNLQEVLDELKSSIKSIPALSDESELEWQDMELT